MASSHKAVWGQGDMSTALPVPENCAECRLGTLVTPCRADDIRRLDPRGPEVRPYRTQVVQGLGPIPCPVLLLGEAPGFHEDRNGVPFWPDAPAGRILARNMARAELERWHPDAIGLEQQAAWVFIDNLVHCRPEDNKIDKFPDAVERCRELYLAPLLARVQPKVVVAMGVTASQFWFGNVRNASRTLEGGVVVISTAHPSSIARGNVPAEARLEQALRRAKEIGYGLTKS